MASVEGEDGESVQTPHWIVVDVPGELILEKLKQVLMNGRILHQTYK